MSGLRQLLPIALTTLMHLQLTANSCARIQEASPCAPRVDGASDHAFWSYSEAQGARVVSSGGAESVCILRTYTHPAYGAAGPVGGEPRGRRGGSGDPGPLEGDQAGKGVKGAP